MVQLETQLSSKDGGGLRFRGKDGEPSSAVAQVQNVAKQAQQNPGVSVQIVAALCLISFLLAYFFF